MKHIVNIILLLVFCFATVHAKSKKGKQDKETAISPICDAQLKPLSSIPEENDLQFVVSILDNNTLNNIEETLLRETVLKLNSINDTTLYVIGHTAESMKKRRIKDSDALAIWAIHKLKTGNAKQDLQRIHTQYWEKDIPNSENMPERYIEIRRNDSTTEEN